MSEVLFARGLLALLRIWPAYQLALELRPPSLTSQETNQEVTIRLAEEITDAYCSNDKGKLPDQSRLEAFLCEFMDVEMELVLEDASEKSIVRDLNELWRKTQAGEGQDLVDRYVEMAEKREGKRTDAQRQRQEGEEEDSSSSDDSGSEEDDEMDVDAPATSAPKPLPVIDEDGFEMVQSRKSKRS